MRCFLAALDTERVEQIFVQLEPHVWYESIIGLANHPFARTHAFERVAETGTVALVTIEFGLQIDEDRLDSFVELPSWLDDAEVVVRVVVALSVASSFVCQAVHTVSSSGLSSRNRRYASWTTGRQPMASSSSASKTSCLARPAAVERPPR